MKRKNQEEEKNPVVRIFLPSITLQIFESEMVKLS
jgi:hypothetical protein